MKKTARSYNSTLRAKRPKIAERDRLWTAAGLRRHHYLWRKYGKPLCEFCGRNGFWHTDSPFSLGGHHIDGNKNNGSPENCYIAHNCCQTIIHTKHIDVEQEDFQGVNRPDVVRIFKVFKGGT